MACSPRDAELANLFVGDRQMTLSHFYWLGKRGGFDLFAAGFHYPDGAYVCGVWRFDGHFFGVAYTTTFVPAAE